MDFSEKYLILLNAKTVFLSDLVVFLQQNLTSQIQYLQKLVADLQDKNTSVVNEVNENFRIERQQLESRIKELLLSKTDSEASLQLLREQHDQLKREKDLTDAETHAQIRDAKDLLLKRGEEMHRQKDEYEENSQSMQRQIVQIKSEFEKERALFD